METTSSTDLTVAILAGGLSHEREISVRSGRRVAGALRHAAALLWRHSGPGGPEVEDP